MSTLRLPGPALSGLAAAALVLASAHAQTVPGADEIRMKTLDNGMTIIVWPDNDIPNAALYNWVRAGGRNEYPGITGVAHYFEHMMFNGTSTREPGEFDRVMEAAGGSNNAYTSNDVTVYQDWFPVSALETILDLESDRVANLAFDPDVVESERGVVFSERSSRVENNNFGMLTEQIRATAYTAHPYQFPVIGWPSDIENWTIDDLKAFYSTYYAPNNGTWVIAGDVDPEEIFTMVEQYFGDIPAQEPPAPIRTVEPEQLGQRRLTIHRQTRTPLIAVAWHVGREADEDTPALTMLMDVLTSGTSSRLHRLLVEETQTAVSVGGAQTQGFDPGLAWIYAVLPAGGDADEVEGLIFGELERIMNDGIEASEIDKARNIRLADFWRGLATINGKAAALGEYHVFHGDYRKLFDVPSRYDAVTAESMQAAAKRYFTENNSTVGRVLPEAPATEDAS